MTKTYFDPECGRILNQPLDYDSHLDALGTSRMREVERTVALSCRPARSAEAEARARISACTGDCSSGRMCDCGPAINSREGCAAPADSDDWRPLTWAESARFWCAAIGIPTLIIGAGYLLANA